MCVEEVENSDENDKSGIIEKFSTRDMLVFAFNSVSVFDSSWLSLICREN